MVEIPSSSFGLSGAMITCEDFDIDYTGRNGYHVDLNRAMLNLYSMAASFAARIQEIPNTSSMH